MHCYLVGQHVLLVLFFLLLLVPAYICPFNGALLEKIRNWLLYWKASAAVLFGGATVVLLHKILHLSVADFGNYRHLLFLAFALICGLSFFKVRDLLALRGLAILLLFLCDGVLDAVYCREFFLHNAFVLVVYCLITFAMTVGAVPYVLRDCIDKILSHKKVANFVGGICFVFALIALRAFFI
jgi:hypothetical protein